MKVSIGRIVIYRNTDSERSFQQGAVEVPAVIVRVLTEACVNLAIFADADVLRRRTSVLQGTDPGTWHWPERVEG